MIFKHCLILFCSLHLINTKTVLREDEAPECDDEEDCELAKSKPLLYKMGQDIGNEIANEMPEVKSPVYEPDGAYIGLILEKLGTVLETQEGLEDLLAEINKTQVENNDVLLTEINELIDYVANISAQETSTTADQDGPPKRKKRCIQDVYNAGKWIFNAFKNTANSALSVTKFVADKVSKIGELPLFLNMRTCPEFPIASSAVDLRGRYMIVYSIHAALDLDELALPLDAGKEAAKVASILAGRVIKLYGPEIAGKVSLSQNPDTPVARSSNPTIQYYFDDKSYDTIIEHRLRSAMNKIEQASCVRFESVQSEAERSDYSNTLLRVTNPGNQRACSHEPSINKNDNIVSLVLGLDCLQEREILHSLLHAIGFNDEVTNPQRDNYVRVMWDNIQPKYRKLFRIQVNENFVGTPVEYDPLSIMHFHARAYSSNGQPTIIPVISGLTIYPSNELSTLDKMKLRLLFGQSCNRKRLTELVDSCKMIMTGDKPKPEAENDNADDVNQAVVEQAGNDEVTENIEENSKDPDAATQDEPKDDNISSSGPEIMQG